MTLILMILSFVLGTFFGNAIQIRQDYTDAYQIGFQDGIDHCTNQLDELLEGDEDEPE